MVVKMFKFNENSKSKIIHRLQMKYINDSMRFKYSMREFHFAIEYYKSKRKTFMKL